MTVKYQRTAFVMTLLSFAFVISVLVASLR